MMRMSEEKELSVYPSVRSHKKVTAEPLLISSEVLQQSGGYNPRQWMELFRFWYRFMVSLGIHHKQWIIQFDNEAGFYSWLLPLVVIGRFFNRELHVTYENYHEMNRLEQPSRMSRLMFEQLTSLAVFNSAQERFLAYYGITVKQVKVKPLLPAVRCERKEQIQPRLLTVMPAETIGNIDITIKTFELLKMKYPRTELTIFAEGSEYVNWKKKVAEHHQNGLRILPMGDAKIEDFQQAQVYLQAMHTELVLPGLVTALLSGLPVVSTPIGFSGATRNGENIALVDFHTVAGLTDKVLEIIENDPIRERMIAESVRLGQRLTQAQ